MCVAAAAAVSQLLGAAATSVFNKQGAERIYSPDYCGNMSFCACSDQKP